MIHRDLETLLIWFRENRETGGNCDRSFNERHFALKFEKDLTTAYQMVRELEESQLPHSKRTELATVSDGNVVRVPDWRFTGIMP